MSQSATPVGPVPSELHVVHTCIRKTLFLWSLGSQFHLSSFSLQHIRHMHSSAHQIRHRLVYLPTFGLEMNLAVPR